MVFVVVVVATDTDTDNELGFFEGVIIVNGESLPPLLPLPLPPPHSDCEAGRSPRTSKLEKRGGCPLELAIDFFEVTVPALALATHPAPTPEIEAELAGGGTDVVPTLEDHDAIGGDVVTVAGAGEVVVVVVVCVTAVSAEVESDERRRPR